MSNQLVSDIEAEGGTAVSFLADVSDEESMKRAFGEIEERFGRRCAAAVFNASGRPFPKPFQWQSQSDLSYGLDISL